MADPSHLNVLKQGVTTWNRWRRQYPNIQPNLRHADLSIVTFGLIDLSGSDFQQADLSGARLDGQPLHIT